jgi:hypothetical protein
MRTALLTACLVASCGLVQSFSIHGGTVSTLTTPSASTRGIALSPAHALPLRSRVQARGFLTSLKAVTFEAQAPDPSVFVALGATVGAMLYWWQVWLAASISSPIQQSLMLQCLPTAQP